jgi:hypothetical protein
MRLLAFATTTLALLAACSAPERGAYADDEHVREFLRLETEVPRPPVRIQRASAPARDLRAAPDRATGTPCVVRYVLRAAGADGDAVALEAVRTADRIVTRGGGSEWFFERNPVAREEVTGFRIDRARRKRIEYPFTDLALEGWASSWSALARLGLEPDELARLAPTGAVREAFGLRFVELGDPRAEGDAPRLVLWSEEHQLPARVERASGIVVEVERLVLTVPEGACPPSHVAYPDYELQDVADWREALHDHFGGDHGDAHGHGHPH